MDRASSTETEHRCYPDGLTEPCIDLLIDQVQAVLASAPRPTSALVDGSAAERRRSRMERRAVAAVVRALPVRRGGAGPDGRAA
ncbi:MAG: hypothetical protein JO281_10660 [Pseudonocardiales bacterium]|nr:hypothetical protein [Pseudonocardiales bacterium]